MWSWILIAISNGSPGHKPLSVRKLSGRFNWRWVTLTVGVIIPCGVVPTAWEWDSEQHVGTVWTAALCPCCYKLLAVMDWLCPQTTVAQKNPSIYMLFLLSILPQECKNVMTTGKFFFMRDFLEFFFHIDCLAIFLFIYWIGGLEEGSINVCSDTCVFKCR